MTDSVCFLLKLLDFKAACLCISELTAGETLLVVFFSCIAKPSIPRWRIAGRSSTIHVGQKQGKTMSYTGVCVRVLIRV